MRALNSSGASRLRSRTKGTSKLGNFLNPPKSSDLGKTVVFPNGENTTEKRAYTLASEIVKRIELPLAMVPRHSFSRKLWGRVGRSFLAGLIAFGQRARARLFRPVLIQLDKLGFSADAVTNIRLVVGAVSCLCFLLDQRVGAILFAITMALDMFDGALARFQGNASDRGKFLDVVVDHIVYCLMLLHLPSLGVNSYSVGLNLLVVPLAYLLAIVFKRDNRRNWITGRYPKLSFLKTFPIVAFLTFILVGSDHLELALLCSNVAAVIVAVYYYSMIQLGWKRKTRCETA